MPELITLGETMAVMVPNERGPLRYASGFRLQMAGAESNTAIGLAKLGHSACWFSRLGHDELGAYVRSAIMAEGVDTSLVKTDPDHRTGLMLKQFGAAETSVFYYRENSAASHMHSEDLPLEQIRQAKILHLTGITPVLSASCRETAEAALDFAKAHQVSVSFDPNIRRRLWKDTDYVPLIRSMLFSSQIALLGLDEAEVLLGTRNPESVLGILREHGIRYAALKDGARGAWVCSETQMLQIAPEPCRPVDPVGAGDGFNAAFLAGILEGRDLAVCGRMGAIAGAMATETAGDINGYPMAEDLEKRLSGDGQIYR